MSNIHIKEYSQSALIFLHPLLRSDRTGCCLYMCLDNRPHAGSRQSSQGYILRMLVTAPKLGGCPPALSAADGCQSWFMIAWQGGLAPSAAIQHLCQTSLVCEGAHMMMQHDAAYIHACTLLLNLVMLHTNDWWPASMHISCSRLADQHCNAQPMPGVLMP